mmetsp:Transcript_328/g.1302  ORF Transcript_328/g.1302 Transcript_328/m.1302 type:complete len:210 (+) Transcript_328:3-632(+)
MSSSSTPPLPLESTLHSYASSASVGSICSSATNSSKSIKPSPSVSASWMHDATAFLASAVSVRPSSSSSFMNTSSATSPASIVPLPSLSSMSNARLTQLGYSVDDRSSASQSTSAARNSLTSMNPSLVVSSCSSSCLHSSVLMLYPTLRSPASSSSGSTSLSPEVSRRSKSSRNWPVSSRSSATTPSTNFPPVPLAASSSPSSESLSLS